MVGFDGSVKLLDFGIAKALALASENRTQVGVLKGKFGYMAPEQVDIEAEVDHRADLFVAGVVLWEMLTLRRLFKGAERPADDRAWCARRGRCRRRRINPAVPPELEAICMRALARERGDRFADCGEMAAALDEIVHALQIRRRRRGAPVARVVPRRARADAAARRSRRADAVAARRHADAGGRARDAPAQYDAPMETPASPSAPTRFAASSGTWRRRAARVARARAAATVAIAVAAGVAVAGVIAMRRPAPATASAATAAGGEHGDGRHLAVSRLAVADGIGDAAGDAGPRPPRRRTRRRRPAASAPATCASA